MYADFPYNGYSAASAFLDHGNTWKPVSATKKELSLMYQKSYSRTHPYIKITPKKLPRSVSAQFRSFTVIYLACTRGFTFYTRTQSSVVLSEQFGFITSLAHSGLWPFGPTDITAGTRNLCRTEIIWMQIIWENISISSHRHVPADKNLFHCLKTRILFTA